MPATVPRLPWLVLVGSLATVAFVFFCYWPLTRFYFSQDDFYFLEKASLGFRESLEQHFNTRPGHFRPLTKGLYFSLMWPVFGMNPFPYHIVSLVLHAINAMLVGVVLRRFGISRVMSCVGALVFAANVSHLEAVAWISCVQELLGATFAFLALVWGVDALASGSRARAVGATVAYALALGSYEQTVAVPLVLVVWQWYRHGWRAASQACRRPLLPMLILLGLYLAYALGLRGLPQSGPYDMWLGSHVLHNFTQYTGSVFAIWLMYPYLDLPPGWQGSHAVWSILIAWHLVRRMHRQLAFGCATFLLLLAPVLFIRYHVFSFHLYLPAIGAWFLLANATDSAVQLLARPAWRRAVQTTAVCAAMLLATGAPAAVRSNVVNYCSDDVRIPQVRVLRRAVLAERICSDVSLRWPGGPRLALVYVGRQDTGNWGNIQSAISDGRALRLVLQQPELPVLLVLPSETTDIPTSEMMLVTELGEAFTYRQYETIRERHPELP